MQGPGCWFARMSILSVLASNAVAGGVAQPGNDEPGGRRLTGGGALGHQCFELLQTALSRAADVATWIFDITLTYSLSKVQYVYMLLLPRLAHQKLSVSTTNGAPRRRQLCSATARYFAAWPISCITKSRNRYVMVWPQLFPSLRYAASNPSSLVLNHLNRRFQATSPNHRPAPQTVQLGSVISRFLPSLLFPAPLFGTLLGPSHLKPTQDVPPSPEFPSRVKSPRPATLATLGSPGQMSLFGDQGRSLTSLSADATLTSCLGISESPHGRIAWVMDPSEPSPSQESRAAASVLGVKCALPRDGHLGRGGEVEELRRHGSIASAHGVR